MPLPFINGEKIMATVIKYIQREVERAFSFVTYMLMARSLWWIMWSYTCLVGRAHGVDQKLGPSCWNQALVIVMEDKTSDAKAFEPLISCPFWPPVLHLRASMIKFQTFGSIIITQKMAKNKENIEWKKEIQTFFWQKNNNDQESRCLLLLCSSTFISLIQIDFCLSLIRFSYIPNYTLFFFSVLAF